MILIKEQKSSKVPLSTALFITFDYKPEIVNVIKSTDVHTYDKKTFTWEVPVVYLSKLLDALTPYDDIQLELLKCKPKKAFKEHTLHKYKIKPFKYQLDGIQYGLNNNNFLLLDAPGLGKTATIIHIAEELKLKDNLSHCLVICGINTLKSNWKKEIEKHSDLDAMILGERVSSKGKVSYGGISERLQDLKNPIKQYFVITNIETLRNNDIIKALKNGVNKFDMIVVDEVHTCKNPTSQQGKNLLKLTTAKHKIAATGTLLMNNPLDVYVPLKWIGEENSTYTNFKYMYCTYGGQFNNMLIGFKNLKYLKKQLENCSLRRTKDILDLPPKTIIEEYVDMSPTQEMFYNNIKSGVLDQVDKAHVSNANVLSLVSRLRQATACPSILTTEDISSAKIDRACDLAEQIISSGNKVVIFSTFKDTVSALVKRLQSYKPLVCTGDTKDAIVSECIDKFQTDDNYKLFIGTHQKCGTGITLNAASYMIFIDTPWTDSNFCQACDRIYRIGTKTPVFIYNLITKNTVDERVLELIKDKEALSAYVIDDQITEKGIDSLRKYLEEL